MADPKPALANPPAGLCSAMSITVPMLSENLTTLPPEVVKALRIKASSLLSFEIEEGGRVILKAVPKKTGKLPKSPNGHSAAQLMEIPNKFPETKPLPPKTATFAALAGTFPKTKPGIKPATKEDMDSAVGRGALSRFSKAIP